MSSTQWRVGQGFDVHAFGDGDHVTLGGVSIPHARGLIAHSDGDVLLHAICDALLGAASLGDIGRHFPDRDPRWRDADSRGLLRAVAAMIARAGWQVANVDATLIAQAPRVAPHVDRMADLIARDLGISADQIGLKATTTERLGFIGRDEGIAALAVAMLWRRTAPSPV